MSKFKFKNNRNVRLTVLICLLLFCSAFLGCGDDEFESNACYRDAVIARPSVSGFNGIELQNRAACDATTGLLSDIFLYTGTGPKSESGSIQRNLKSIVGDSCQIRESNGNWDFADDEELFEDGGNQYWYWILCVRKDGGRNNPNFVLDVGVTTPVFGLLPNGPPCYGSGYADYKRKTTTYTKGHRNAAGVCVSGLVPGNVCDIPNPQFYDGSGELKNYVNRGGFYDMNGDNPRSVAICVPTKISTPDDGDFSFTFTGPACDKDGVCATGEDNSCDDCLSCAERAKNYLDETGPEANKLNKISCQGDMNLPASYSRNPFCKWCPRPYQGQGTAGGDRRTGTAYPFMLPGYSTDAFPDAKSGCVHVTGGDPFNCGVCGLSAEIPKGSSEALLATDGLCAASLDDKEVYCVQNGDTNYWSCESGETAIDIAKQPWFSKYANSKRANPSFFYTVESVSGGGWKSSVTVIPAASATLPGGGGLDGKSNAGSSSSSPSNSNHPQPNEPNPTEPAAAAPR